MAIDFPTSVANGYIYTDPTSGSKFQYYTTPGVWKNVTFNGGFSKVSITSTAPSSPNAGDFWFYQDTGELFVYYTDGDSSQWVTATGGGGINNANNALSANNSTYLGGLPAASYVNTSSLTSSLTPYALLAGGTSFTGNVSTTANLSVAGTSSHTGFATFANSVAVTGNVVLSNTLSVTGTATFTSPIVLPSSQSYSGISVTVGNSSITNTSVLVGNSTANAYITASSIVVANATATATISPGTISSSNTSLTGSTSIATIFETATVNTTPIGGSINIDVITSPTIYFTSTSSSNFAINVRGNSTTSLNSILANGQSVTTSVIVTQGWPTGYYPTSFSVDGVSQTVKWVGGSAPTAGSVYATDLFTYTVVKISPSTYSVFASSTKYA